MASSFPSLLSGDLSYVDPIPPTLDIECPVCFGILFEPYLSDCCGHHFCGTCIPKLKYKPCPLCKKSFSTMLNLSLQRLVKSVKIYCPNNIVGCEWKGELSFISKHEQQCLYVLLECENCCGKKIQRSLMDKHRTQYCSKRLVKCSHCFFVSTSDDINVHSQTCPEAFVNCPNGCLAEIARKNLSEHFKDCPLKEVECEFAQYGCKWKQKRKQLESHLNESWKLHNSFVIESFNTKISSQQEIISALCNQVSQLADIKKVEDTRIKNLEDNVGRLRAEFEQSKVESDDDNDEIIIKHSDTKFYVGEFNKRKSRYDDCCLCPMIYTDRPGGYKMRLVVRAGGVGFAKGTHVSVFIRFLRGSYDSQLHWPFRGEITIRLCDQVDGEDNYERIVRYTNKTPSQYAEIAPGCDCSDDMGIAKFISYETLERDDWLLDHDRLEFEISQIAYKV